MHVLLVGAKKIYTINLDCIRKIKHVLFKNFLLLSINAHLDYSD